MIEVWFMFHIQILWYSFTRDKSFLLPASQSPPGKQENLSPSASRHISNSFNVYLFLYSEMLLGKSQEFSNERMKVLVKRAFKRIFCLQKNKKADRHCMKLSSTSSTRVQRCQNERPHFLLPPLFWRMPQPSGQDQQNCKRTCCRLQP